METLNTLNKMLGFLCIKAILDSSSQDLKQETTFLASEITFFAEQLLETAGPILWFNNEEQGNKVMSQMYPSKPWNQSRELFSNINQHQTTVTVKVDNVLNLRFLPAYIEDRLNNFARSLTHPLLHLDQIDKIKVIL